MKRIIMAFLLFYSSHLVGANLKLNIKIDFFPKSKDKGCQLVIKDLKSGASDTLIYKRNKFNLKFSVNSGKKELYFFKEGYISKKLVINTQAVQFNDHKFFMEIDMLKKEEESDEQKLIAAGKIVFDYEQNAFIPHYGRLQLIQ